MHVCAFHKDAYRSQQIEILLINVEIIYTDMLKHTLCEWLIKKSLIKTTLKDIVNEIGLNKNES